MAELDTPLDSPSGEENSCEPAVTGRQMAGPAPLYEGS